MLKMFPEINHIDEVRVAIQGRPEFIEATREGYTVFNYMVAHEDSFDCPIRRECRGLVFDENGCVLSRRFHKFFNLGEKEHTLPDNINWNIPHVVLEKLDGSMITPLVIDGNVRWATKMGITDVAIQAEDFIASKPDILYEQFALLCHEHNMTPIFEFISPDNRIVLPYKESKLIILAIRENVSGKYLPPEAVRVNAYRYNIPVVDQYHGLLDDLKNQTDMEGVVVRFENGEMIKIKTEWYVAIHKAKENILFEKNVIKLILEEKIDDILPNLPDSDKERVIHFKEGLLMNIELEVMTVLTTLIHFQANGITRKQFATEYAPKINPFTRSILFACWDNNEVHIRDKVIALVLKNCSSQKDVDSIRNIIKVKWKAGEL
jgi:RNA ligase